jgi:hypothetical protein
MATSVIALRKDYQTSVVSVQTPDVGALGQEKQSDADKQEVKRLRKTNPTYDKYLPLWNFYLNAFEGGSSMACRDNLFQHPREHKDDFEERAKRVYYHNYCDPIVGFFTTFIYAETIQRDVENEQDNEWFKDFIADVNLKGEDITTFMKQISDFMQIFGMVYTMVDSPANADGLTEAQQKEQNIRPYWVVVRPDEILDWVVDEFDKPVYLKRRSLVTELDESNMTVRSLERYYEWSRNKVKISAVDVTQPEKPVLYGAAQEVLNPIGKIPVVVSRYRRSARDKYMGHSFVTDLSFMNREIMNLTSLLQEFLYRQCFNILAMPTDPNVPEIEQLQGEIGTANMLRYPNSTDKPEYITPPIDPAKFLQDERRNNIQEMFRIAAEDTVNDLFNGSKRSGFSQSQSFKTTVPKIATRADELERTERELLSLTMAFRGKKWAGTIKYKDHYEITNLTDAINQLSQLFKDMQIKSKTFAAAEMKRFVHEFDGKLTSEQMQQVEKEIDATDWEKWFGIMELAFVGRGAMAPEADTLIDGADPAAVNHPVRGKDTATAASTPQRAQGSSAEIAAEANKTPASGKK